MLQLAAAVEVLNSVLIASLNNAVDEALRHAWLLLSSPLRPAPTCSFLPANRAAVRIIVPTPLPMTTRSRSLAAHKLWLRWSRGGPEDLCALTQLMKRMQPTLSKKQWFAFLQTSAKEMRCAARVS